MSLISAMYSGVSGIKAFTTAIQVTGNNLSNLNTVGFKSNRAQFGDLLSQNLTGASVTSQLGRGTRLLSIGKIMTQGTLTTTDVNTDVAVEGNGWFRLQDNEGRTFYSRNGQFRINDQGVLVNDSGLTVIGYPATAAGEITQTTGALNLFNVVGRPNPTGEVSLSANLSAEGGLNPGGVAFDSTDPINTSNFSTSIRVYDSLGADHELTVFFRRTSNTTWEWHALAPGSDIDGAATDWVEGAAGELTFTTEGALDTETVTSNPGFSFVNGAAAGQTIDFDFGDSITTDGGAGLDGTTQFAGESVVNYQSQDGFAKGTLVSIAIDSDGVIAGLFDNGQTRNVGQLGLASFASDTGLESVGSNLYRETSYSGQASFLRPGQGVAGTITSNALEQSNVDIANEFVQMIQNQRAYQANTKIVTVSDQLLNETVNLIR